LPRDVLHRSMSSEAQELLALARQLRWRYPSSLGRPVGREIDPTVEELLAKRDSLVHAAELLVEEEEAEAAIELAANAWRLWMLARDVAGGRAFVGAVLDGPPTKPSRARALALYGDGVFAFWQDALEDVRARNEAALEDARAVDDPEALALAHLGLARVAFNDGGYDRARDLAMKAREYARGLEPAMGQGPLHTHAQATRQLGDHDVAASLFEESLALNRRIDDQGMVGVELHNLGHVEIHRGNADTAERYFAECAELGSGDDPYSKALGLGNEAAVAFGRGDRERAQALLDRAESLLHEHRIELAADDRFEFDWLRRQL
jgi:tetratricopeptide (TPR) repeat protein